MINKLAQIFISLTILLVVTGCSFITSKMTDPNNGSTSREAVCADLKSNITFNQDSHIDRSSGQRSLPTDNARAMKNYDRYNCQDLEKNRS